MAQEISNKRPTRSLSEAMAEVLPEAMNRQADGRSGPKPPPLPRGTDAVPVPPPTRLSTPADAVAGLPAPAMVTPATVLSIDAKLQATATDKAPDKTADPVPAVAAGSVTSASVMSAQGDTPASALSEAQRLVIDKLANPPTEKSVSRAEPSLSPLPASDPPQTIGRQAAPPRSPPQPEPLRPVGEDTSTDERRRAAKRRAAGPAPDRAKIAANDDLPTIGGLIYALEQKPSKQPFKVAAIASAVWLLVGGFFAWGMLAPEIARSTSFAELMTRPAILITLATVFLPIGVFAFLAWLLYQAQDLRLRSSAMTEVAIRLAEPDRNAEQAVASLGQSVRKQLNFMNEAVSRAIGRAGELESMVHNEVASLDRSFSDNEDRIRRLISELASERNQLTSTSDQVHTTLRSMGEEVPALIEKLSSQQTKLAKIIEGAGQNLIALEGSLLKASGQLETSLGDRTAALQSVLTDNMGQVTSAISGGTEQLRGLLEGGSGQIQGLLDSSTDRVQGLLVDRTTHLQTVLDEYTSALHTSLSSRTDQFQTVFEEFTLALDTTLDSRAQTLDTHLVERTRALDSAFSTRLQLFDDSIRQSTMAIDSTVGEKAQALSNAMEAHARQIADTLGRQSQNLDEQLMQGISAVRRTSENITRQSVKAIEGLSGQADMLRNVSENLLTQIGSVTSRFENQGQSIMRAANALENANYRIDQTLQSRHRELHDTLGRLTGTTDALGEQMQTYRTTLEGSLTEAEQRARLLTNDFARGAQTHAEQALSELQKLKADTTAETQRAMDDMRNRFSSLGQEMSAQVGSLSNRLTETSDDLRTQAQRASEQLAREQDVLRQQASRLPDTTRETADAMRRVLAEQMRALEQISSLAQREAAARDVQPPVQLPPPVVRAPAAVPSLTASLSEQPNQVRPAAPAQALPSQAGPVPGPASSSAQRWSLGDLLARASQDEPAASQQAAPAAYAASDSHAAQTVTINLESIARALDAATANAIWTRFRSGQRGIMVRSIYTAEGRTTFDEVTRRYASEPDFRAMVDRFLGDFERLLRDTEQKDRTGQMLQGQLTSGSGRVYLFLAHASGRLH